MSNSFGSITPKSSKDDNNGTDAFISITSIIVGVIVIMVIPYLIKCIQKIKMYFRKSSLRIVTVKSVLDDIQNEKLKISTPDELKKFTNHYAMELGSGGFGKVYRGQYPNGTQIAVKLLKQNMINQAGEQLMAEVSTLGITNHINLINLYGYCDGLQIKALVYEYMENGSLYQYLFGINRRLTLQQLYKIAVGVAKGIRYLHEECREKIVHGDIKPTNILLDRNFLPKIADFGTAMLCNRNATHIGNERRRGTYGYVAPEIIQQLPMTHKCDVYSYGMLLFDVIGGSENLELNASEKQDWPMQIWDKYDKWKLRKKNLLLAWLKKSIFNFKDIQLEKIERMYKVACWCIQHEAQARPSMSQVVRMLEGQEKIKTPPNPFRHLT